MKFNQLISASLLVFAVFTAAAQSPEPEPEPEPEPDQEQEQEQQNEPQDLSQFETAPTGMTQSQLKQILSEIAEDVKGGPDNITFYYNGANMALLSNLSANRMRIIAPVVSAKDMNEQQILASLVSNYHLALDARYAIGDGVLYSVYIHPLKELTDEQFVSAVRQVATLRNTFGTSYTSGELSFGVQAQEEEQIDL